MIGFIIGVFVGSICSLVVLGLLHAAKEQDRIIEEFYNQARREKAAAEQAKDHGRKDALVEAGSSLRGVCRRPASRENVRCLEGVERADTWPAAEEAPA
jgi:hypothetical protein